MPALDHAAERLISRNAVQRGSEPSLRRKTSHDIQGDNDGTQSATCAQRDLHSTPGLRGGAAETLVAHRSAS